MRERIGGRAVVAFGRKRRTTTAPANAAINADIRATSLDWYIHTVPVGTKLEYSSSE
jgi:hypothetical protein